MLERYDGWETTQVSVSHNGADNSSVCFQPMTRLIYYEL